MITVVGEALIDLVISPSGEVEAALGGAPFNTARACGRLGAEVAFVGALADDRFGSMLARQLVADGVDVTSAPRVDLPTTLAAAELDEHGAASYRFYIEGTSAPVWVDAGGLAAADVVFTGGLGLVLEPMATNLERALDAFDASTTLVVDVNCRPLVVPDRAAFVARVERVVGRADVVKVSDDDVAYLFPGLDPMSAAHRLIELGAGLVLVTAGGEGVHVVREDGTVSVPVESVPVVDTIGAGDTFGGAFLAWLAAEGALDIAAQSLDVIVRAVSAANVAAGIVCTRRGADPPHRSELADDWSH